MWYNKGGERVGVFTWEPQRVTGTITHDDDYYVDAKPPPTTSTDTGEEGKVSYDEDATPPTNASADMVGEGKASYDDGKLGAANAACTDTVIAGDVVIDGSFSTHTHTYIFVGNKFAMLDHTASMAYGTGKAHCPDGVLSLGSPGGWGTPRGWSGFAKAGLGRISAGYSRCTHGYPGLFDGDPYYLFSKVRRNSTHTVAY